MGVKIEPPTELSKLDESCASLTSNKEEVLKKFQDILLESKKCQAFATKNPGKNKWAADFLKDTGTFVNKTVKLVKMLETLVIDDAPEKSTLVKLVAMVEQAEIDYKEIMTWAVSFNFKVPDAKRRRVRKTD